jgi:hypothetical protein
MPESVELPGDWEQTREQSRYDSFMDREYTTLVFTQSATGQDIIINDVQEPNNFEGWGYLVHVTDPAHGEIALVDDLQTAREVAHDFMNTHPN